MKLADIRQLAAQFPFPSTLQEQQAVHDALRSLGLDPSNLYQELEMSSPLVDTHQDTSFSNATISLHSHSFYELLYCRNTCGAEYLVGTDRYRLQKGDIVFIAPGISHRPLLPKDMSEPYHRDILWISCDLMEQLTVRFSDPDFLAESSALLRTAGTKWEYLGELFHNGVTEAQQQAAGWEMAVIGNTLTLLTHIRRAYRDHFSPAFHAEKPELMEQIMAYVEAHLSEKITLTDIAKRFWVSQSTISQTFRQKMGVSFYRCVTQRRLIAAKAMILEGMMLEEVGQLVGFTDYSTFYRAFKQEYGISPRQFRKIQEQNR